MYQVTDTGTLARVADGEYEACRLLAIREAARTGHTHAVVRAEGMPVDYFEADMNKSDIRPKVI